MPGYRLYYIGSTGRIEAAREFAVTDDRAAISAAEQNADGRSMELWQLARVVRKFPAALSLRPAL